MLDASLLCMFPTTTLEEQAMPNDRTGHIKWGSWSFDYSVSDAEGLSLSNGSYQGVRVIGKFSLPVIRVKYLIDGGPLDLLREFGLGAGPYADRLRWNLGGDHGLQKISNMGDQYVGIETFISGGTEWMEIAIYARIGPYHIAQQWYLSETGYILPRVWSKGLTINMDHTHHPYWRLDFDIDGADSNRVYGVDNKQWFSYAKEANDVKNPATNRVWFVRNEKTGSGAWVIPGHNDGQADRFSGLDVGVRLFHVEEESNPWPFGIGGLRFPNGEDVSNSDIVFWYIAHMFHRSSEGGDAWNGCGPTIKFDLKIPTPPPPSDFRIIVRVQEDQEGGEIKVLGFGCTPGGAVEISFLRIPNRTGAVQGYGHADPQGQFVYHQFVRCTSQDPNDRLNDFDVYAFDVNSGNLVRGTASAKVWVCGPF
jgi:hypothetical protein